MNVTRRRPGVGLVEVLVVVGVIGLLVGLLLGAVQSARGAAARAGCAGHLRQLGVASAQHHDTLGRLPQPYRFQPVPGKRQPVPLPWTNDLLPFLEQEALWRTIVPAHQLAFGSEHPPHVGLVTVVKVFACPADGRLGGPITDDLGYTAAYGSYLGVVEFHTRPAAMDAARLVRMTDVTDGASQTLLLGERPPPGRALAGNWYTNAVPDPYNATTANYSYGNAIQVAWDIAVAPGGQCRGPFQFGPGRVENPCDSHHFWSLHPGGANFLYVDGSVHFHTYAAAAVLPALATRAGGEVVSVGP